MEVSNNSKTDPAAWVARVVGVTKKAITVEYPFHDTPGETHKVLAMLSNWGCNVRGAPTVFLV